MANPSPKAPTPKAPQFGAFPLDHFRECKDEIVSYYTCLRDNDYLTPACRDPIRVYLQCRMDRGLMNPGDIEKFGIPQSEFVLTRQHRSDMKNEIRKMKLNQVETQWKGLTRDDLGVDDGYEKPKEQK